MSGVAGVRSVNGILGLLCKKHYPGLVLYRDSREPAFTFDHYEVAPDPDYRNVAEKVKAEFWVSLLPNCYCIHTLFFGIMKG